MKRVTSFTYYSPPSNKHSKLSKKVNKHCKKQSKRIALRDLAPLRKAINFSLFDLSSSGNRLGAQSISNIES